MHRKIWSLTLVATGCLLSACNLNLLPQSIAEISNVNGAQAPEGPAGSTVVVRGAGFGDTQGSGKVYFSPAGGGLSLVGTVANAADWSQAAVSATVPAGAPGLYVMSLVTGAGVSSSGLCCFTLTPSVPFTPSAVTWSAGPALPGAVSGTSVAFGRIEGAGFVYAVGGAGASGTPVATVSYAAVQNDGSLGAWQPATSLPVPLAFTATVAATQQNSFMTTDGFLFVLGGTTDAAGTPVSTVYRAPFNPNGSIGAWSPITALPAPLRSIGAVILFGSLYIAGGATTGNAPVAVVYRSAIQTAGVNPPLSWLQQASLPGARARFAFGASGLYLYAFGGDSIAVGPNDTTGGAKRLAQTVYARINPSTGTVAAWTTASTGLALARSAFPGVFATGNVVLTGGLYSGASTHASEATYASINSDGTLTTFTAVSPATSINSLCSCNLFNHGATPYVDGTGVLHLLIVGGDNVNAPGAPRAETFLY